MQATRYNVLSTAYPRYHYSVKNGVSISKRFNVILKDIGFDNERSRFNLPEIEEPQIIVVCENEQAQTVDIADIELNKLYAIREIENKSYIDFETLIDDNKVNDLRPIIVVVELKDVTSSKASDFAKWNHNVIVVVNDMDSISSKIDDVLMTNKENLSTEICLMLERTAFRNMQPLIPVLRDVLAAANFKPLTEVVRVGLSDTMSAILKKNNMFVGWMNDIEYGKKSVGEMGAMAERNFEQYLLKDSRNKDRNKFRSDINTKYIVKFEEGRRGKRKEEEEEVGDAYDDVPIQTISCDKKDSTKTIDENNTSTSNTADKYEDNAKLKRNDCKLKVVDYFKENDIMYELIGKLAKHIEHTLEQEVITEYKTLPKEFKNLLSVDIENQNIKDKVAAELFKLFVCTIDSKLDDDDPAEEMVLVKLRYRTGIILRGLRDIVAQLKLLETTDHHIKLIKVESDRAINRLFGDLNGLFSWSNIPDYEKPRSGEFNHLNDKVAEKLQGVVKEAKDRWDKLHIFVERIIDQDNSETVESHIKKILLGYNIQEYILSSTTRILHFDHAEANITETKDGHKTTEKKDEQNHVKSNQHDTEPNGLTKVSTQKEGKNDEQDAQTFPTATSNGETTQLEKNSKLSWPNEEAMKAPVIVKRCDSQSQYVKDCIANPKVYSFQKARRGICLIVSNKKFTGPLKPDHNGVLKVAVKTRHGTEKDVHGLTELFNQLHFEVVIREDLTAAKLREVLQQESLNRTSQDECFVCIICSHGSKKGIYGTDGEIVKVDDITTYFDGENCEALVDKPKLFFIQACLGGGIDKPSPLSRMDGIPDTGNVADTLPIPPSDTMIPNISTPTKADMVVACATHSGYVCYRNRHYGSWFLQAVIYVFKNLAWKESLLDMLTEVNDVVAQQSTPSADGGNMKQASMAQNSLRKKLFFFPGVF